ncbi:MAG: helix-turn-helix domain-containing protein [Candidatus Aminicenantes bacterium]|nr:helix-turn-helix domain-containing protein [Candidatus Aminicenantes bacterium]
MKNLTIHDKMEIIIEEMIEKELSLKDAMREFEKIFIEKTAVKCKGNKTKMAENLGLHRNTLRNRIKKLKISSKFSR